MTFSRFSTAPTIPFSLYKNSIIQNAHEYRSCVSAYEKQQEENSTWKLSITSFPTPAEGGRGVGVTPRQQVRAPSTEEPRRSTIRTLFRLGKEEVSNYLIETLWLIVNTVVSLLFKRCDFHRLLLSLFVSYLTTPWFLYYPTCFVIRIHFSFGCTAPAAVDSEWKWQRLISTVFWLIQIVAAE